MSATPEDDADGTESASDRDDYIDDQEEDSFPASDPHSDWSGPPERE